MGKFIFVVLSLSASTLTTVARADFHVGNGGNTVECAPNGGPFAGLYSLDYLATYSQRTQNSDIVPVQDWQSSLKRIGAILNAKYPVLGISFQNYLTEFENYNDLTKFHRWIEAPYGVYEINDSSLINRIPHNCGTLNPDGTLKVNQTVVRISRPQSIEYHVNYDDFERLKKEAPLQFSFLAVHEWAWDWSTDIESIRQFVRFLHSDAAERATPEEFKVILSRIGYPAVQGSGNGSWVISFSALAAIRFATTIDVMRSPQFHQYLQVINPLAESYDNACGDLMMAEQTGIPFEQLRPKFRRVSQVFAVLRQQFYTVQSQYPDRNSELAWTEVVESYNQLESHFATPANPY